MTVDEGWTGGQWPPLPASPKPSDNEPFTSDLGFCEDARDAEPPPGVAMATCPPLSLDGWFPCTLCRWGLTDDPSGLCGGCLAHPGELDPRDAAEPDPWFFELTGPTSHVGRRLWQRQRCSVLVFCAGSRIGKLREIGRSGAVCRLRSAFSATPGRVRSAARYGTSSRPRVRTRSRRSGPLQVPRRGVSADMSMERRCRAPAGFVVIALPRRSRRHGRDRRAPAWCAHRGS
jgi:hypothetical protein